MTTSEYDGQRQKDHVPENEEERSRSDGPLRKEEIAQGHGQNPDNAQDPIYG